MRVTFDRGVYAGTCNPNVVSCKNRLVKPVWEGIIKNSYL